MKNGCKEFVSPTMDKIKIQPYHKNRLHDITYAKVFLRLANNRGKCLEETLNLVTELYMYVFYLYSKIEQLEKDKRYLLEQNLKNKQLLKRSFTNEIYNDKRSN